MKASSLMALLVLACAMAAETANAQAWSLTNDQRRAYLRYYSPILMYRTDENAATDKGFGWVTNFDYDRDGNFSTNKANWDNLPAFIAGNAAYSNYTIRPTMYTALIEFMEPNGTKSLQLIYHVYHAKEAGSIHDWERIEIQINNVNGTMGSGTEQVKYVVVTQHISHDVRMYGHSDLNFQITPYGKHAMIWQANWNGSPQNAHEQELRFVENSFAWVSSRVAANNDAEVEVNGSSSKKNVHYVFVNDADPSAVSFWNAQTLTFANASTLYSGKDNEDTVKWSGAKRIKYELQDLADILPTHWHYGGYATHWHDRSPDILIADPVLGESGALEMDAGRHWFYNVAIDIQDPSDDSDGYPDKVWMWGAYDFDGNDSRKGPMYRGENTQPNRAAVSGMGGLPVSGGDPGYWWQHDYFVHNGQNCDPTECGRWLPGNWYTPAGGGFDGRWVQLFTD
jgi:hypothetical protein